MKVLQRCSLYSFTKGYDKAIFFICPSFNENLTKKSNENEIFRGIFINYNRSIINFYLSNEALTNEKN